MRYIETFREGMHVSDVYLCKNKQIQLTKNGKEYGNLVLQDKTGTIDAKIWDLNSPGVRFNDFMTQCRQSPFVRRTASPQNRIRDDPPACVVTEADGATAKSVWKQKNKSSTIKINGTMSKEIFVAFATQKGGIGKSTVTMHYFRIDFSSVDAFYL